MSFPSAGSGSADPAAAEHVRQLFLEYCKAGKSFDDVGEAEGARLAEVLKKHLRAKAEALVRDHPQQSMLYSYQSDATSYLCQGTARAGCSDLRVLRRGRVLEEFLMERGYLFSASPGGKNIGAVIVGEPRPLTEGTKAWNLFSAGAAFFPVLRQLGHKGICITHLGADRAAQSALARLFRYRRAAYYTAGVGPDLGEEADMLEQTDFFVSTGCAAHDISNAIKWGMSAAMLVSEALLKEVHIVIESLRNSFTSVHSHLGRFLRAHLEFGPRAMSEDEATQFWRVMGVDPVWMETFVDLDPRWVDGRLVVNEAFAEADDAIERLSSAILYLWKWKKFCESRWCTVGLACRALVASISVGLEEVVAKALGDSTTTNYHLNGFKRLGKEVRLYICVASVAAFPSDALQRDLLEDDRVLKCYAALHKTLADEVSWVENLDACVWERLVEAVFPERDVGLVELRTAALRATFAAQAFVEGKIFTPAKDYPWKLALGNVSENLDALLEADYKGPDDTTLRIKGLLSMGYNRARLADAVRLLQEIPWTTMSVEQAHGSMAVIHRLHPALTKRVLCHRTLVHQCRALFHTDPEEKFTDRLQHKVEQLHKRQPEKVTGRHLFLRDLMEESRKSLLPGAKMSAELRQSIMRRHGTLYNALDLSARRNYDRLAQKFADDRASEVLSQIGEVKVQTALHKSRLAEENFQKGVTNRLSHHRFQIPDLSALGRALQDNCLRGATLDRLRAKALAAPQEPAADQRSMLKACGKTDAPDSVKALLPQWLKVVCQNREKFRECGLFCGDLQQGDLAYMLLYASQNPIEATFLQVRRARSPRDYEGCEDGVFGGAASACYEFEFDYEGPIFRSGSSLAIDLEKGLFVLREMFFVRQQFLGTDCFPVLWERFVAKLPAPSRSSGPRTSNKPSSSEKKNLMADFPWLRDALPEAKESHASGRSSSSRVVAAPAVGTSEVDLDAAYEALNKKRREWELTSKASGDDFYTHIMGGNWLARNKNKAYDGVMAKARGGAPIRWTERYGLNTMATFRFNKHGEGAAERLAEEWAARMQHFYDLFVEADDPNFEYNASLLQSYEESTDWTDFLLEVPAGSPVLERAALLRATLPSQRPLL